MSQNQKHLAEISNALQQFKKVSQKQRDLIQKYMTGQAPSELIYLGLSVPQVRSILKKKLSVYNESLENQFAVFSENWFKAPTFEQKALSLYWLESLKPDELKMISKKLISWSSIVDNWAHSDCLCSTYAKIFDLDQKKYLPIYKKWNKHKNPWLRRISMVGLFYYSRSRKNLPSFQLALQMVKPHFQAQEYYVQKAVGWTLREMYNVYPRETIQVIDQNIHVITPIAWVAASEKLKPEIKNKLLKKRKLKKVIKLRS